MLFLNGVIVTYVGRILESFVYIIAALFFVILILNIIGLLPGSYCLNGHISVTLTYSSLLFFGILFLSVIKGKAKFFLHFIPENVPSALKPFLTVIEIISFISRLFSLAIRLFANLVAGHSLLHILADAGIDTTRLIVITDVFLTVLIALAIVLIMAIFLLELGIAALQAYVFAVLSLIYLKECELFYKVYKTH